MCNRRLLVASLWGSLLFLPLLFNQQAPAQQASGRPKKVLTPEQKVYQQQWKEYMVKRHTLQAHAKQVFEAEMVREKAKNCPNAGSTYDYNICFSKQVTITEENLKSYESDIRELMASAPRMSGESETNMRGPAGPNLTSAQLTGEFDAVEQSWRQYRDTACTAAFHQFGGGTGGPSFQMQCGLRLSRSHMRELDMIYDGKLHR